MNVVGVGGMNKYEEIQMKIFGWTGNRTQDPCITSQVLYHWAIQADIHGPSSPNNHIDPCPPIVYTYSIVKIYDYYLIGFLEQKSFSRLVSLEFEHQTYYLQSQRFTDCETVRV